MASRSKSSVDSSLALISFDRPNIDRLLERASQFQQAYRECHVCIIMDFWLSSIVLPAFDKQEDKPQGSCPTSDDVLDKLREITERLRSSVLKRAKSRKKTVCSFCLENTDYHDFFDIALKHLKPVIKAGIGHKSLPAGAFESAAGPLKQLLLQTIRDDKTPKAKKDGDNWLNCMRRNFEWSTSQCFKLHVQNSKKEEYPFRNITPRKRSISSNQAKEQNLVEKAENLQITEEYQPVNVEKIAQLVEETISEIRKTVEANSASGCANEVNLSPSKQQMQNLKSGDRNGKGGNMKSGLNFEVRKYDENIADEEAEVPVTLTYYLMYRFHHEIVTACDILSVRGKLLLDGLIKTISKKKTIRRIDDEEKIQLMGSKIRGAVSSLSDAIKDGDLYNLYRIWPNEDIDNNRSYIDLFSFLTYLCEQMTQNINDTCGACYGAAVFDSVIEEDISSFPNTVSKKMTDMSRLLSVCETLKWVCQMIAIRDMFRHFLMDVYFVDHCYNCCRLKDQTLFDDVIIVDEELFGQRLEMLLKESALFSDK